MAKAFNLFGDIVDNDADRWFGSDVTPAIFIDWLAKQDGDIEVNINSNGGSVTAGLAIANAIKGYNKGDVTCNVLGIAASMASVIACAGKRLCMGEGAFLMVHNPWTVTMGDADDLRKDADTLDQMRDSIIGFYQSKCPDKAADEFKAIMDAETWLNPEGATAQGFAVEAYAGELKAAAALTRRAIDKAPEAARALLEYCDHKPAPADNWEARYKGLSKKFAELQQQTAEAEKRNAAQIADIEAALNAALEAKDAEITTLKSQLDQSAKDLADANAKVSELAAKVEEDAKALHAAEADLAQTRDSLTKAEERVKHLEETRDALTAGVLTPPAIGTTYADKMKAAKTPEEREELRAQKRAGRIK